ncbi:MAG: amino acid adenylation domain-containing protein [Rhodococcus sp. (in: high G+C Gram-positive bacteria)]|uniref:amino acid adenylation domain-containing protein n=1 Tax=Rhodococcus sp. TaxID=1831 RepID=UPI003BB105E1
MTLEDLGRSDFQVKIRGQRIELGEVEAALRGCAGIAQAVAAVRTDRLVAYAVPEAGCILEPAEITRCLGAVLPSHMVPSAVLVLDSLPRTASGKIDRAALPAPAASPARFRAPSTPFETTVAEVFAQVLGRDRVSVDDDFFALGGNSLTATRVVARVGAALGTDVGVRDLFDASTVGAFAARAARPAARGRPRLVPRTPRPERVPLSAAQTRIWFLNRFDPSSPAYNIAMAFRLAGALDEDALRAAFLDVVRRHESLRTIFPVADGEPIQRVTSAQDVPGLTVVQIPEPELASQIHGFTAARIDLTKQVPLRARIFALGGEQWVLCVVVHHIAADGASMMPLARDVMAAYSARIGGRAPRWRPQLQYTDYTLWQREMLGSETDPDSVLSRQLGYWRGTLAGLPAVLELPVDRARQQERSPSGARVAFAIDADLHRRVTEVASEHRATVFMVAHAAFATLLAMISGSDDIAVGTPVGGRGEAALDNVVGMFVNTVVLRLRVSPRLSFVDLLEQAREVDLGAYTHADVPFEKVVELLDPPRSTAHAPLFQVMLEFQNTELPSLRLPGLTIEGVDLGPTTSIFDLQLTLSEDYGDDGTPAGMSAGIAYATDLFDTGTVERIAERFLKVLEVAVADPSLRVADFDILDRVERAGLAPVRGLPAVPIRLLPEILESGVACDPDASALSFAGTELSYRELDKRSNRLARLLISRGAGPDTFVAVAIPRSIESVLAVWAVAKSGAAFLPVDPNLPVSRMSAMITDSGPVLGLTVRGHEDHLPDTADWVLLDDPALGRELSADPVRDTDRLTPLRGEHPAYLMYTSGTTGAPKGVVVTHTGLADLVAEQIGRFDSSPRARVSHATSPSFDASVFELLLAFGVGATLVIVPPSVYGGAELAALLEAERVTHAFMTPSVLDTLEPDGLGSLRVLVVAGERFPPALAARWANHCRVFDAYGPTEATVQVTVSAPLSPDGAVTLGGPAIGFDLLVLDSALRPVPEGVLGELFIAGPGLARGSHRRAATTAARFVANPVGPQASRMYRTGDLVRWTRSGELEFWGRNDLQVKIRGQRVELGDIETVLARCDGVVRAAVAVREGAGGPVLVGYVVPEVAVSPHTGSVMKDSVMKDSVLKDSVMRWARDQLPPSMVPAQIVVMNRLPLDPSGKLDRAGLPAPVIADREFHAPRTEFEVAVAETFGAVLSVDRVGVDDNFFDLGGSSLAATTVAAALRDRFGQDIPVQWIFRHPTAAALARRIAKPGNDGTDTDETLSVVFPFRTGGDVPALFCIHPAGGLALGYSGLIRYLAPDRPAYGLQLPILSGGPSFDSVEQLARHYADEIRRIQPDGPYHLLGWSFGGVLAHAMGVELRRAGQDVATVAMMDSYVAEGVHDDTEVDAESWLRGLGVEFDEGRLDRVLAESFGGDTALLLDRIGKGLRNLTSMSAGYHPGVFDGDLLFFRAGESAPGEEERPSPSVWQTGITGTITEYTVDCDHLRMTGPGACAFIGPILDRYLRRRSPH